MTFSRISLVCATLALLMSCSDQEPAATAYKKSLSQTAATTGADQQAKTPAPVAPGGTPPATTPAPAGTTPAPTTPAAAAGDKAAGLAFYNSKGCGGCHGADGKGQPAGTAALSDVGNYDKAALDTAKPFSPAHAAAFPTTAADTANLLAHINSFTP